MKKDNTFKQAARWVARMFGYKAESRFGRVMWHVFFTSAAIVTFVIVVGHITRAIRSVKEYRDDRRYERMMNSPTYLHDYEILVRFRPSYIIGMHQTEIIEIDFGLAEDLPCLFVISSQVVIPFKSQYVLSVSCEV